MKTSIDRLEILRVYKQLLSLGKLLPSHERQIDAYRQIRSEFRKNATECDPKKIQKLFEKAGSSISFMKMITPKVRSNMASRLQPQQGRLVEHFCS